MEFPHYCTLHHLALPADVNAPFCTQNAYNAEVLQQSVFDIANINDEDASLTPAQEMLKFSFMSDYLAVDTDKMTVGELADFLEEVLVFVDKYFYRGSLTQGQIRFVKLHAWDLPYYEALGYHDRTSFQNLASHIHIFLRSPFTGKRWSTSSLVHTVLHESVHAYLYRFFNFCPVNNRNDLVSGEDRTGHGILFRVVLLAMFSVLANWHPSLKTLGKDPLPDCPIWWPRLYKGISEKYLRDEWEVTNLQPHEPTNIFRYWKWRPARKAQFKKALLELSYITRGHYVELRVPSLERAWRFIFDFFTWTVLGVSIIYNFYLFRLDVYIPAIYKHAI
ncbi:hypothetical protein F5B22DRAFT_645483 [Xylaria bambusicola]|uniref:uncharacterized protein n=1 Tax=Xylaria bambusicola TaxID=326684 RepID=UPI002007866A|nr:uncharacterized protein F5B22DRAFT_645483 [Xylaria bambusicola]KAI0517778.1 hypothetical protein F5B22DRAFT_645483 [Xylaria bambusicola]